MASPTNLCYVHGKDNEDEDLREGFVCGTWEMKPIKDKYPISCARGLSYRRAATYSQVLHVPEWEYEYELSYLTIITTKRPIFERHIISAGTLDYTRQNLL